MATPKAARWLDLIAFLLQHRFAVTREEIFEKVGGYLPPESRRAPSKSHKESARRKFERDKDELRSLGIDIETVELKETQGDEPAHGYRLRPEGFYLPYLELSHGPLPTAYGPRPTAHSPLPTPYPLAHLTLSPPELRLLDRATRRLAQRREFPLSQAAASARRKLAFDLPLDEAEFERVIGIPLPEDAKESLAVLQRAVAASRAVSCRYYSIGRDADETRVIEPYGLLFQSSHWYCVARSRERDALRMFRLDRMREARLVEGEAGEFQVPDSFDVRDYLSKAPWELGEGPAVAARIRFGFPESRWVLNEGRGKPVEPLLDDGGAVVEFDVRNRDAFLRWLLPYRRQASVLEPDDLAQELEGLKRKVAARHA